MRYALIGCGRISTNHIKAAIYNQLEIVAVCDVEEKHMQKMLLKHGLEKDKTIKWYTDYHKMLEEHKLDLISIATESGLHGKIALDCIGHGINTIIEKPMAMSLEEADQIIALSKEKKSKSIRLPPEPFQFGCTRDAESAGSRTVWEAVSWFCPCSLEQGGRLL